MHLISSIDLCSILTTLATKVSFNFFNAFAQRLGQINKRVNYAQEACRGEHIEHSFCAQPIHDERKWLDCAEHHQIGQRHHNAAQRAFYLNIDTIVIFHSIHKLLQM